MANFVKPETALNRAEGLINVGQKEEALKGLHDVIIASRKFRSWQIPLEKLMFLYVELCVELERVWFAKDGLIQYRNVCQQVNISSLESVIQKFLDLATKKAEISLAQVGLEPDDDLMLSHKNSGLELLFQAYRTSDHDLNLSYKYSGLKFLFEAYRTVLETLKNNSMLEELYAATARRAFQFCRQHNRTAEFRRLCETIRNHLANFVKYSEDQKDNRHWPDVSLPETLQLYLNTRFEQLNVATELHLWQETFRSVEDIHGLMSMVGKTPKASLMVVYYARMAEIFWRSSSQLGHAYALLKLFTIQKSFKKNLSQRDLQLIASSVVLAALSVPPYDHHSHGGSASHSELQLEKEKNLKMASIIRFDVEHKSDSHEVLSRAGLFAELESKGVLSRVTQEVKDLYHLLEDEFIPLDLATKVQPLLAEISELGVTLYSAPSVSEIQMSRYVPALEKMATVRLLRQVSQVYQTIKIDHLSKMISFFDDFALIEKLSADAVKHNFIAVKVNHLKGVVSFGQQKLESDDLMDHLTQFAESLSNASVLIYPSKQKAHKIGKNLLLNLSEVVEEEHKRLLARKCIIEQRKVDQERQLIEMEKEKDKDSKKLKEQVIIEEADQKKLATERQLRKHQNLLKEKEEKEKEEREREKNQVLQKQRESQEKEKKLLELFKTEDHLERAKREESATLVEAAFQQRIVVEAAHHEREQQQEIELSRQRHAGDLKEKSRLERMLENKRIYQERVVGPREAEFNRLRNERQYKLNIIQARKQDRTVRRKMIFYLRLEEERQRKLRDAEEEARKLEEARKIEEIENQRKEEAPPPVAPSRYVPPSRRNEEAPPAHPEPVATPPARRKYVPPKRSQGDGPETRKWGRPDDRSGFGGAGGSRW
ncbi:OLC1v1007043C1 [Oldenlandia corymbosa var. corymbosa]|uniref:OLC1v1007043C1 n=1 Tax=Oldenlandia corymbosa var. corymbosa TaxID=529605 RepID=A0AAV1DJY2_OLDCO|nr:OLC1v1007043C1 [Oldenlandia corymbosa var. corymbosa]